MKKEINALRKKILYSLTKHIGTSIHKNDLSALQASGKPIRILINRPNSRLGNLLMITPLLQEIEDIFPQAKVDLFVRGGVASILYKNYNQVDHILTLPGKPFKNLYKYLKSWFKIRKEHYDLVLNTMPDSSSGRLSTFFARATYRSFGESDAALEQKYPDYRHMAKYPVYNFRQIIHNEKVKNIPELSLNLSTEEIHRGEEIYRSLVKNNKPTLFFYTYATGKKCFTKEWWKQFYNQLEQTFPEYNLIEVLPKENISQIDFKAAIYYSKNLREMSAVLSCGALFLTADCGVMHLASASRIPTLALFNITPIEVYRPYNVGSKAVNSGEVSVNEILKLMQEMLIE